MPPSKRNSKNQGNTASKQLPINSNCVGPPRRDPYKRLLSRFYEPLFLLRVLGQTRGEHTVSPPDLNLEQAHRRKFLRNLAFVCDFKKGGDTCTAIGLEDSETCYKFWIASNTSIDKIIKFANNALSRLKLTATTPGDQSAELDKVEFTKFCLDFAASRVRKEHQEIKDWLDQILEQHDCLCLCLYAYRNRKSGLLRMIGLKAREGGKLMCPGERLSPFALVIHYLGRLANHVRAPRQLVEDASHLTQILESYQVSAIDCAPSVPRPVPDNLTTLDGILNRMLKKDDPERLRIKDSLLYMNSQSQSRILEDLMEQYDKCTPQVHAEVQALDHFFRLNLFFVGNDRYIACIPESHRKVWVNWGPQLLQYNAKDDPEYARHLKVLNEMTAEIRRTVIAQILGHSSSSPWHPDSRTAISEDRWSHLSLEELS
ncbi:hypothetical protein CNMCM8980_000115 [Aspergillus fumigatiaffinis]|uniref:Uncharacterized protein n=1 Tax=Aspergillus fumigatiaffinis TaxID=340414 RepID=A0A8H4GUK2_9EURO|nr:hypothetical protein CNMCM6805_001847 [Aspergillus fumigatiaffinis]KAF4243208.1 hypothetical protein CNMCM8980_000115 [Aspergillus fumigatiaffinis]